MRRQGAAEEITLGRKLPRHFSETDKAKPAGIAEWSQPVHSATADGLRVNRKRSKSRRPGFTSGICPSTRPRATCSSCSTASAQVQNAEVVTYRHNQRSKGFAFVQMLTVDEAKRAVEELHDKEFLGRKLVVSGAKSSEHHAKKLNEQSNSVSFETGRQSLSSGFFLLMKRVLYRRADGHQGNLILPQKSRSELDAEIVSADAFQIYRGLDLLTAKPDRATLAKVPHHLIGAFR